jgi:hypothetical protein
MTAENARASIETVTDLAIAIAKKYVRKELEAIVGVEEVDGEWRVTVETLERKAIPDSQDLLGRYEIRLNTNGELVGWTQKVIRKRCDPISPLQTRMETT